MEKRIWQADALRGLALVNMLAYHALYDWVYIFGHSSAWYSIAALPCRLWQQYICWSFLLLSGYCFSKARRPLKNGLVTAGCAAVLTAVTAVFMPSEAIWFGVLHLNAAAVLLTCLVRPALDRCPAPAGLAVCAALFALTYEFPQRFLGFFALAHWVRLPDAWYAGNWFWLGLRNASFVSADYFPVVPWLFLFWCGLFAARLVRPRPAPPPKALRPLCCAGRRTLVVYMLHQPVLYGALWVLHTASIL